MTPLFIIYQSSTDLYYINLKATDFEMVEAMKRASEKENELLARWKVFKIKAVANPLGNHK